MGWLRAQTRISAILDAFVERTPWVANLAKIPATRSNTSVCLTIVDPEIMALDADAQANFAKNLVAVLEKEGVAYDIGAYRDAPSGLRIWAGATVESADVEALTLWLDWAFQSQKDGSEAGSLIIRQNVAAALRSPSIKIIRIIDGGHDGTARTRIR